MRQRLIIDEDSVPALPARVTLRFDKARDRWVMLAAERVLMPDDIAVEILRRLGGRSVRAIADDLAAKFEAPPETISRDVIELLQDLADKGLIET